MAAQNDVVTAHAWALDNVYIGMQCVDNCGGHGACVAGVYCDCDVGFEQRDVTCVVTSTLKTFLREDFESISASHALPKTKLLKIKELIMVMYTCIIFHFADPILTTDVTQWQLMSGASVGLTCGQLVSGNSLVFNGFGVRQLVTVDLDLTRTRLLAKTIRSQTYIPRFYLYFVILQFDSVLRSSWLFRLLSIHRNLPCFSRVLNFRRSHMVALANVDFRLPVRSCPVCDLDTSACCAKKRDARALETVER